MLLGHRKQLEELGSEEYVPLGQSVHGTEDPIVGLYCPGRHPVQTLLLNAEYPWIHEQLETLELRSGDTEY